MHPGAARAVRRWTSPFQTPATLKCRVSRGPGGDGVGINIYLDGAPLYSRHLPPGESDTFTIPGVALRVGSKVDFTVDQHAESSFDSTAFAVSILRE
jgi:hypothetical protein